MDDKMEELIPIVADLAKQYAGCDNTSITYETAQRLMQGVIFCLNEYRASAANQLCRNGVSMMEQYQTGRQLVFEKTKQVLNIYNEMSSCFDDYNVICLRDTVQKGIPEFLKWYDAKFFPQDTILTLDYLILEDIHLKCGVDAVYTFITSVQTEQRFLHLFDRNYIVSVLKQMVADYEDMIDNITSIVLINTIGHIAISKSFRDYGFQENEYVQLSEVFSLRSISDIECILKNMVHRLLQGIDEPDSKIYDYLCNEIKNIAVRIDNAVKYQTLDKIFII